MQYHPENAEALQKQVKQMFEELNHNVGRPGLMAQVQQAWDLLMNNKEDGWYLTGIKDFRPDYPSFQLTLERKDIFPVDTTTASKIRKNQSDKYKGLNNFSSSDTEIGSKIRETQIVNQLGKHPDLPVVPRLEVRENQQAAYLCPHFNVQDPHKTIQELNDTNTVIQILNDAIAD